jgi:hypothetical protein
MSGKLLNIDQLALALSEKKDQDEPFDDRVEEYIEFAKLHGAKQRYDEIGSIYDRLRPLLSVCDSTAERVFLSALVIPGRSYRPRVQSENPPSLLEVTSRTPNWQGAARVSYRETSSEKSDVEYVYNFYPQALIQPFIDDESQYRVDFAGVVLSVKTKGADSEYSRRHKSIETVERMVVEFGSKETPDQTEKDKYEKLRRSVFEVKLYQESKVLESPNSVAGGVHYHLQNKARRHTHPDY